MSASALALVVCAAFIHASWNLMAKRAAAAGPVFVLASSTIATLAYRLFNFGLMLPAGLIGWMAHRNRLRRLGRQEFDPDLLLDRPDHDLVVADTDPVGGDKPASTTFFHDAVDADRTGRK